MCFHSVVCNYLYRLDLRENRWVSKSCVFCGTNCDFVSQYYRRVVLGQLIVNWRETAQNE